MKQRIVLDTGPLVAFLNGADGHHAWARDAWTRLAPPFLTTEPVLTEAFHLLSRRSGGTDAVFELLERGVIQVEMQLAPEARALRKLMRKYANVPMSLADASLVRLVELQAGSTLMTLDRDFRVYRQNGRQTIPLIAPN